MSKSIRGRRVAALAQAAEQQRRQAEQDFIHEWQRVRHDEVEHEQPGSQREQLRKSQTSGEREQATGQRIGHGAGSSGNRMQ